MSENIVLVGGSALNKARECLPSLGVPYQTLSSHGWFGERLCGFSPEKLVFYSTLCQNLQCLKQLNVLFVRRSFVVVLDVSQ